ncbi:MAG: hypothetical protein MUC50_05600 [Myxococcota bacterium]|jgi:hypothetical protein|nr:hypothetical protein [Myxococcota bacterium]
MVKTICMFLCCNIVFLFTAVALGQGDQKTGPKEQQGGQEEQKAGQEEQKTGSEPQEEVPEGTVGGQEKQADEEAGPGKEYAEEEVPEEEEEEEAFDDSEDSFDDDEERSTFRVNGYFQMQTGFFVPLGFDGVYDQDKAFQDHKTEAYKKFGADNLDYDQPCDPAVDPSKVCYPIDHGGRAGDASMFRGTVQLDVDWEPTKSINLHAVMRAIRAMELAQDYWAQPPKYFDVSDRPAWVADNLYNQIDIRELYLDIYTADWLSFRIGRQPVTWGETGQYRLLDVINPVNESWHFGPLESFEDMRTPLWLVKSLIEFQSINHDLELVFVPGIDRPEDSVTTPLSFVGAWGLPPTNTPSPFLVKEKKFLYPSQNMPDSMRGGFRWKGSLGSRLSYSLVYYYTHQLSPPVPSYYDLEPCVVGGAVVADCYDNTIMKTLYLEFPRQHIAGLAMEYTFDNPIGMVVKLEAAFEPDRTFPRTSSTPHSRVDESFKNYGQRYYFETVQKQVMSYAVVLMRPTMIRWLNPTQNFMFLVQWMHTIIPNLDDDEKIDLVNIPGFNKDPIATHSWKIIGVAGTSYLHGLLAPKVVGAYVHPNSGFVTASLDVRLYDNWRFLLSATDFFGKDPYKGLGLFRDRDEINLRIRFQF